MSKVVVIGGSAGALSALKIILSSLPQGFPAAILIVTHIGANKSLLPEILQRVTPLLVRHAVDGEPIVPGKILLAPGDEHLTVVASDGSLYARLSHGPRENHFRPAIDPLFRSAAAICGADTIGVILTGHLDDGTIGLQAVKARGGFAIVQDPLDAEAPDMPSSALRYVDVDLKLDLAHIAAALIRTTKVVTHPVGVQDTEAAAGTSGWIDIENRIISGESDMEDLDKLGAPSSLTCPECNGSLWEIQHPLPSRYRCHTGHAFTTKVLAALQRSEVEEAIWSAMRALHEQERLFLKMSETAKQLGHLESSDEYLAKSQRARKHSQALREVIEARVLS